MNRGSLMLAAAMLGVGATAPLDVPRRRGKCGGSRGRNGRIPVNGSYLAPLAVRLGKKRRTKGKGARRG